MLFCIAIWVALFCSNTDWYMHTLTVLLLNNFWGQSRISLFITLLLSGAVTHFLLPGKLVSGERDKGGHVSLIPSVSSLLPTWRLRSGIRFPAVLNRLGIEGLFCVWLWAVEAAAVAFLHPEEITAVVAAVGNNPPCCPCALGLCG